MDVQIEQSWKDVLQPEFDKPYFAHIVQFLKVEKQAGKVIFPPGPYIFNAFNTTPFDKVKVVILGQDPYHNPHQAHGLCFSVQDGIAPPPSLVNIFKEMEADLGITRPNHGNLQKWAEQGILLLNASLTVEMNKPMSHSKIGWHDFTNSVIQTLSDKREKLVFILWGGFAKSKLNLIDTSKHCVLTAAHPSPLSAHNGFFGCKHFSKTNEWLQQNNISPIDWSL
ncbi:MAG: uracil-DNA glycosylase [Chitinophagales bacterium]|nr:uracil-DNA glycosylase [Chitinophagaceae bacterium]MCB9064190.1 uracil-DNA glycosylase [Chitinophagales bacterium]